MTSRPLATGLAFLGIRADHDAAMSAFLSGVLGLEEFARTDTFVAYRLPNGDVVEVFDPLDPDHAFFESGPVAGFAVDDIDLALTTVTEAGLEVLGEVHTGSKGSRWFHLRGPDGHVYELLEPLAAP